MAKNSPRATADPLFQAWLGAAWLGVGTEQELVDLRAGGYLPADCDIRAMTAAELAELS